MACGDPIAFPLVPPNRQACICNRPKYHTWECIQRRRPEPVTTDDMASKYLHGCRAAVSLLMQAQQPDADYTEAEVAWARSQLLHDFAVLDDVLTRGSRSLPREWKAAQDNG